MGAHHKAHRGTDRQVVLEDLRAWVDQLYEEFGGQVNFDVTLTPTDWEIKPALRLTVVKRAVREEERVLWEDWRTIGWATKCEIEHVALHLVSRALLELSSDAAMKEAKQSSLWG